MIIDYERLQTFGFLGFIRMWKVVKIWICLLHISLFLYKIPNGGYKELWNKSTFNGVIGSVALYCSEITIFFTCKALDHVWSSVFCDEAFHCYYHTWWFWVLMVFYLENLLTTILVIRKMSSSLRISYRRLLWNNRYKGSYPDEELHWLGVCTSVG